MQGKNVFQNINRLHSTQLATLLSYSRLVRTISDLELEMYIVHVENVNLEHFQWLEHVPPREYVTV